MFDRIESLLTRLTNRERNPARKIGAALAAACLCTGLALSLHANPKLFNQLELAPWIGLITLVPLTLLLNSVHFRTTAHIVSTEVNLMRSLTVTVFSTAANMLPLPGGSAVRIAALKSIDCGYSKGITITLLTGIMWIGSSCILAAIAMILLGSIKFGVVLVIASTAVNYYSISSIRKTHSPPKATLIILLSVQLAAVATGATRILLSFATLSEIISIEQSFVIGVSHTITSLIGVVPGGLGITETSAAALGSLVGAPAALAFTAAFINRLTGLIVITPLSIYLASKQ